jgi:type IV pilus assembly protein PilA
VYKYKIDNKAFSLVELIIVMAIMAALVGILAPQYMKYVSKTEKTRDCSTINTILNACETMALDPDTTWRSGATNAMTIVVANTGATYSNGASNELNGYVPESDAKLKSSDWGPFTIVATMSPNGRVVFDIDDSDKQMLNKYSAALAARLE